MCDIVLASEDTWFDDGPHFARGMVPGDSQHIVWQRIIGPTRASLLLTNQKLTAQQAQGWGVVNEVLPKDTLLDRAYELAREIVKRPPRVLRYTRTLLTQNWKRACLDELSHGVALELYAQPPVLPAPGGMRPMVRAWDEEDPMGMVR